MAAVRTPLKAASLSTSVLLNEDFENIDGSDATHPLPDGWTATAANDVAWHSGIVVIDNNQVIGKSGDIYAYLLINNQEASDAWAMSPKFRLEAGTEYVVRFYVMLFSVDDKPEGLKAYIGDAPDASAMTTEIYDSDGAEYEGWKKVEAKFTPDKSGDYYVGLHSQSPEGYGATFIDDVQVIKGGCPIASAATSMDMGNKLDIASSISKDYVISNIGTEPLNVSLQQATQGLEVEGLPATIAAGEQANVKVLLTTGTVGDYKGTVDFATNDPGAPSFQLSVTGKVAEARVSENYHLRTSRLDGLMDGKKTQVWHVLPVLALTVRAAPLVGLFPQVKLGSRHTSLSSVTARNLLSTTDLNHRICLEQVRLPRLFQKTLWR